jgi:hypothetical protein
MSVSTKPGVTFHREYPNVFLTVNRKRGVSSPRVECELGAAVVAYGYTSLYTVTRPLPNKTHLFDVFMVK